MLRCPILSPSPAAGAPYSRAHSHTPSTTHHSHRLFELITFLQSRQACGWRRPEIELSLFSLFRFVSVLHFLKTGFCVISTVYCTMRGGGRLLPRWSLNPACARVFQHPTLHCVFRAACGDLLVWGLRVSGKGMSGRGGHE